MVRDEPAAYKEFGWSAALLDDPEEVGFGSGFGTLRVLRCVTLVMGTRHSGHVAQPLSLSSSA